MNSSERRRGRFRRWLDDWQAPLFIALCGLLAGAVAWLASGHQEACRLVPSDVARPHSAMACPP